MSKKGQPYLSYRKGDIPIRQGWKNEKAAKTFLDGLIEGGWIETNMEQVGEEWVVTGFKPLRT